MKTLMLAALAALSLGLGVAQAAQTNSGSHAFQRYEQQEPLMGGGN
jgi:hypothetical protein